MVQIDTFKFGTVGVDDSKKISFEAGLPGFEGLKDFALIHDEEKGGPALMYLQSLEDKDVAITVASPLALTDTYSPAIEEKDLEGIGELKEDNIIVLVTVNIPDKIEDMSANLKSPIIINTDTLLGAQIIVEDEDALVRFPVYEILKAAKEKGGA